MKFNHSESVSQFPLTHFFPVMLDSSIVRVVAWPGKFHRPRVSASLLTRPTTRANNLGSFHNLIINSKKF